MRPLFQAALLAFVLPLATANAQSTPFTRLIPPASSAANFATLRASNALRKIKSTKQALHMRLGPILIVDPARIVITLDPTT